MDIKAAAALIESEYRARAARAEEAYRRALATHPALYEAEKAARAAVLDGKPDDEAARLRARVTEVMCEEGLDPSEFVASPRCSVCKDTGRVNGRFCDCARRRAAKETVGSPAPSVTFADSDLSVFEGDARRDAERAYDVMRIFCEKFPATKNINVLLLGGVGTGKTYLAACMASELEKRGYGCLFLSAFRFNDLCLKYHTSFDAGRADGLNALLDADLLVIDDLGTESVLRNVTLEYLYTVINERMSAGRHTVITTNLTPEALEARYGERTVSRLFAERVCLTVALNGKDLRR